MLNPVSWNVCAVALLAVVMCSASSTGPVPNKPSPNLPKDGTRFDKTVQRILEDPKSSQKETQCVLHARLPTCTNTDIFARCQGVCNGCQQTTFRSCLKSDDWTVKSVLESRVCVNCRKCVMDAFNTKAGYAQDELQCACHAGWCANCGSMENNTPCATIDQTFLEMFRP